MMLTQRHNHKHLRLRYKSCPRHIEASTIAAKIHQHNGYCLIVKVDNGGEYVDYDVLVQFEQRLQIRNEDVFDVTGCKAQWSKTTSDLHRDWQEVRSEGVIVYQELEWEGRSLSSS